MLAGISGLALALISPASPTTASADTASFTCGGGTIYALTVAGGFEKIDLRSGAQSAVGQIPNAVRSANNALALPPGRGHNAWYLGGRAVHRYDIRSGTTTDFPVALPPGAAVAGAVNPVNGIYYFAQVGPHANPRNTTDATPWPLYGFDTRTETFLGRVAVLDGLYSNGDIAFDQHGNLYAVSNGFIAGATSITYSSGPLVRYAPPPSAGSGTQVLQPHRIATMPDLGGAYSGIAFDRSGRLAISVTGTKHGSAVAGDGSVVTVNPADGSVVHANAISLTPGAADLASCSSRGPVS
ncbi:hypothetical protein M6D93_10155 [Jatrophihabitans telluris]|uniref:SMP-30/Gluconolactonase/LRE-like region domain-containing protein n=1 Tax=Jatrophihabitans telluris TaxID=2038343 RepID=A0ABY4QS39_9ACTN|nr:hypothetical protein [Jatrophihabitans telluris]UQX86674.1 hypothetical protein M6D93_10155 [Jatrophihabitans telluris]